MDDGKLTDNCSGIVQILVFFFSDGPADTVTVLRRGRPRTGQPVQLRPQPRWCGVGVERRWACRCARGGPRGRARWGARWCWRGVVVVLVRGVWLVVPLLLLLVGVVQRQPRTAARAATGAAPVLATAAQRVQVVGVKQRSRARDRQVVRLPPPPNVDRDRARRRALRRGDGREAAVMSVPRWVRVGVLGRER